MPLSTQPLVLVADDEPRITKLVSIALGGEGFRVITAENGEEALRKAEEVRPDVVLLDIVMPDLEALTARLGQGAEALIRPGQDSGPEEIQLAARPGTHGGIREVAT